MKVRPIRVLLIAPSFHILGGQAVQAQRLMSWLAPLEELSVSFQPINPKLPGPWRRLQSVRWLRTAITFLLYTCQVALRAGRSDLLHVFTASYWSYNLWSLPALFIAKLYRRRIILNYRDGQCEDHLRNWRTALPTIRRMDAVVSPSADIVKVFARFQIQARHIPNIIDMGKFHYRERVKPRPLFLHNRILEPLYNIECTLRAFQRIQKRYPEASLTLAHDGPSRRALEAYAESLGLQNFRFVGKVPYPEMPALYDAHDVYLTSPNFDCFPGSLMECYSSGLPVIATSVGGIPYIARNGETALLVEPNDDAAIAAAAFRLLEQDGLSVTLARNARRLAEEYTGPAIRDQWAALYRELAGTDRGTRASAA